MRPEVTLTKLDLYRLRVKNRDRRRISARELDLRTTECFD